ncbi:MAG: glutathione S-transferase family protein [Deltaproteobacteria bacterium]|nr:MAG: glutathione S-transferase family protein [Deltaproteobacteria bacterium]
MIVLYFAPGTRSIRVRWLLEELGLPYVLRRVTFKPPQEKVFAQDTPLGRLPVIEDGEMTMCESGAIIEYVLERYGNGRLAPPVGSPLRGEFLQWMYFAEASAFPPLGVIVRHALYKGDADKVAGAISDARERARTALDFVERALDGKDYLLGGEFSAADVMMGFTLMAARALGVLDQAYPRLGQYLARLEARPAFTASVET